MAERGAQLGNNNATKNRPWREAIDRALAQGDGKRLRKIAETLLTKASEGDMTAIRELGDRLDGKPAQAVSLTDGNGAPFKLITEVVLVRPASKG